MRGSEQGSVKERDWMDLLTRVFSYENKKQMAPWKPLNSGLERAGAAYRSQRMALDTHTHTLWALLGGYIRSH